MKNVYEKYKIYGPYKSKKDNRLRIVAVYKNEKKTISYPKYLLEMELNRYLAENETIHHIDGNPLNNDLSNLKILSRKEHCKLDAKRRKDEILTCQWCKKIFVVKGYKLKDRNRHQTNSFCSKQCVGKYGKHIQLGGKVFDKVHIRERYFRNKINEELNIGKTLTFKDDGNTEA